MTTNEAITALITATQRLSSAYFGDQEYDSINAAQDELVRTIGVVAALPNPDPMLKGVLMMANDISDLISDVTE